MILHELVIHLKILFVLPFVIVLIVERKSFSFGVSCLIELFRQKGTCLYIWRYSANLNVMSRLYLKFEMCILISLLVKLSAQVL